MAPSDNESVDKDAERKAYRELIASARTKKLTASEDLKTEFMTHKEKYGKLAQYREFPTYQFEVCMPENVADREDRDRLKKLSEGVKIRSYNESAAEHSKTSLDTAQQPVQHGADRSHVQYGAAQTHQQHNPVSRPSDGHGVNRQQVKQHASSLVERPYAGSSGHRSTSHHNPNLIPSPSTADESNRPHVGQNVISSNYATQHPVTHAGSSGQERAILTHHAHSQASAADIHSGSTAHLHRDSPETATSHLRTSDPNPRQPHRLSATAETGKKSLSGWVSKRLGMSKVSTSNLGQRLKTRLGRKGQKGKEAKGQSNREASESRYTLAETQADVEDERKPSKAQHVYYG